MKKSHPARMIYRLKTSTRYRDKWWSNNCVRRERSCKSKQWIHFEMFVIEATRRSAVLACDTAATRCNGGTRLPRADH
jgi:hypothetical protein